MNIIKKVTYFTFFYYIHLGIVKKGVFQMSLLDENHDVDAILREPFDDSFEEENEDEEEEISELNLGGSNRISDLDIPDEEEDTYDV